jgi:calcium-dependent protein kinase
MLPRTTYNIMPLLQLYEYYEDQHNIYLILEFCDGGELFDRLHEQTGSRYTEAEAARLMFKMCAAIGYCHYMGISHRDLKLENFIFEARDAEANIKLIDFVSASCSISVVDKQTINCACAGVVRQIWVHDS